MTNNSKGWQRTLLVILPFLIVLVFSQLAGVKISGADLNSIEESKSTLQELIISTCNLIGISLLLWIFMKFIDRRSFTDLGFRGNNKTMAIIVGIGGGFLLVGLGYGFLLFLREISFESFTVRPRELIYSVLLFTVVSVLEEIFFRGYILRNLMISFNKYLALIISAVLFSVMHGLNPNVSTVGVINIFLAGFLLGLPYIHLKSLWVPVGLHFSLNFFQTHFGFNVSGQDPYSLINTGITEPNLLNGGPFGYEGSILFVLLQMVSILLIEYYFRRSSGYEKHRETQA